MSKNNMIQDVKFNTIDELMEEHPKLLQRVKAAAAEMPERGQLYSTSKTDVAKPKETATLSSKSDSFKTLLKDVDDFLKSLSKLSADPVSVENYLLICDTAVKWEHKLSSMLNVYRTVALAGAPPDLLPRLAPGDALSEAELNQRVSSLAKIVYAYRLRSRKDHDDNNDKAEEDWHKAEVFLALDILDGTINFARRISSRAYPRLEQIWAAEMRELIAYLDWEKEDGELFGSHTIDHYLNAWKAFEKRLRDPKIKATSDEFGEAKQYLEEHYVTQAKDGYRIDYGKLEKAGDLNIIKIKSNRIGEVAKHWDHSRKWDNKRNWDDAETYVKMYYENIIPAVMGNTESAQKVIDAFDYSMKSGTGSTYKGSHRIINAFELILAVYFISVKTSENIKMPSDKEINSQ